MHPSDGESDSSLYKATCGQITLPILHPKSEHTSIRYQNHSIPPISFKIQFLSISENSSSLFVTTQSLPPTSAVHHDARTPPPPYARDTPRRRPSSLNLLFVPRPLHRRRYCKPHPRHNKWHIQFPPPRKGLDGSGGRVHSKR